MISYLKESLHQMLHKYNKFHLKLNAINFVFIQVEIVELIFEVSKN